jgi:cold shock CspA family protein
VTRKDDTPAKPFHIQRRRLGVIKFVRPEGDFGFIDAEDFREDVFFHKSVWRGEVRGVPREPIEGAFVEFEIDEEYRAREKKFRATIVTLTDRPMGRRISIRDAPHLANPHHPKARQKRPTWRGGKPNAKPDQDQDPNQTP